MSHYGGGGGGGYYNQRDAGRNWRDRELGGARGGATHLARIHGTEEDKVNCPFFFKIGACRHGDRCSRQHHKPPFSQTMIIQHMYQNPASQIAAAGGDPSQLDEKKVQEEFDDFYEEVFEELAKHGEIEELNVCENLGDHMVGNVYVKFADEEYTNEALQGLWGRFYAGRPLVCEFSPVTDFREARCRQYDEAVCSRGGYCNFMHIRTPSRSLRKELERRWYKTWKKERQARERAERGEDEPPNGGENDDASSASGSVRSRRNESPPPPRGEPRKRPRSAEPRDDYYPQNSSGKQRRGGPRSPHEDDRRPPRRDDHDRDRGYDRRPTNRDDDRDDRGPRRSRQDDDDYASSYPPPRHHDDYPRGGGGGGGGGPPPRPPRDDRYYRRGPPPRSDDRYYSRSSDDSRYYSRSDDRSPPPPRDDRPPPPSRDDRPPPPSRDDRSPYDDRHPPQRESEYPPPPPRD